MTGVVPCMKEDGCDYWRPIIPSPGHHKHPFYHYLCNLKLSFNLFPSFDEGIGPKTLTLLPFP